MTFNLTFPAFVTCRLVLAFTSLPIDLKNSHLLASPLTSYTRLQEGIYLFKQGFDPYSGGLFRHSPLLLSLFSTALPPTRISSPLFWTFSDAIGAWALVNVWRTRQGVSHSSRDSLIAASYLFNPYLLLSSLALSSSTIENALYMLSLLFACRGKASASLLTLSFLVHLSLPSIVFVIPVLLLLLSGPISRLSAPRGFPADLRKTLPLLAGFVTYSLVLLVIATLVSGNLAWVEASWLAPVLLPDLTPNPGLWWYFFTEMFDHFRSFFLMVFSMHLLIYIVPVCIKFQHDLLYASFLLAGIVATFKSYPTLSDSGVFLSMLSLFPETFPYLRHPVVTALLHLHAALLLPLFHHMWLQQGTGNANFLYASTLVFGMANGGALLDSIWAGLRIALGQLKEEYEVVQE